MIFKRKSGIIGLIGMILILAMLITIIFEIPIPTYLYVGINIVGAIFMLYNFSFVIKKLLTGVDDENDLL